MIRFFIAILFFIAGLAIGKLCLRRDIIKTDTNSTITSMVRWTLPINSPPPSAISPQISASNSDLCTVGVAGAVQTHTRYLCGRTVET